MPASLVNPNVGPVQSFNGIVTPFAIRVELATVADGTNWGPVTMKGSGRIVGLTSITRVVASTSNKATTLNLRIGSTDLTGGVLALTTANCDTLAETNEATAITGGNTFNNGDTLSLIASSTTTFSQGAVDLLVFVEYTGNKLP